MKNFILLFIWIIIISLDWVFVVLLEANNVTEENKIKAKKFLVTFKTIGYLIAVVCSLLIGYLIN